MSGEKNIMKTEYTKFKKNVILADAMVTKSLQIKISGKKEIAKFVKDCRNKFTKTDYKAMYKIKLKGESDKFIIEPEEMKFKDFKGIMEDAEPKNIKQIQVTFYHNILPELPSEDVEILCKMLKKTCERYDAKVRQIFY